MPVYKGSSVLKKIYVGAVAVKKCYLGTLQTWPDLLSAGMIYLDKSSVTWAQQETLPVPLVVDASGSWTLTDIPAWLTASALTGTIGLSSITLTPTGANTTYSDRSATITATLDGSSPAVTAACTVLQSGLPALAVSPLQITGILHTGQAKTFTVTCGAATVWNATTALAYVTLADATNRTGPGTFTATYAANAELGSREGDIAVTDGSTSVVCETIQNGDPYYLSIDKDTATFASAAWGEQVDVDVTSAGVFSSAVSSSIVAILPTAGSAGATASTVTLAHTQLQRPNYTTQWARWDNTSYKRKLALTIPGVAHSVAPTVASCPQAGGAIAAVTLTTNCKWRARSALSGVTFDVPSGGPGTHTIVATLPVNYNPTRRSVYLYFEIEYSQGVFTTIFSVCTVVTQLAINSMTISPTSYSGVTYAGATLSPTVTLANESDYFNVISKPAWITTTPAPGTKHYGSGTLSMVVAAQEAGSSARSANVTILRNGSYDGIIIPVAQLAAPAGTDYFPATNPPTGVKVNYNSQPSTYDYFAIGDGTGYRTFKKIGNDPLTIRWYYSLTPNQWRLVDGVTQITGVTQA